MKNVILTEEQYQRVILDRLVSELLKGNEDYQKALEANPGFINSLRNFVMNKFKKLFGMDGNNGNQGSVLMASTRPTDKCINMISMFENGKPYPAKMNYDDLHGRQDGNHISYGYGLQTHPDGGYMEDYPQAKTGWSSEELNNLYLKTVNKKSASEVSRWANDKNIELTQNQFDALVSIVYNCGPGCLKKYRLFNMIAANPKDPRIADEWQRTAITSKGKVLKGLVNRRQAEATLYQTGQYPF